MKGTSMNYHRSRTIGQWLSKLAKDWGVRLLAAAIATQLLGGIALAAEPKTFGTPEEAAKAMVDALRADNRDALLVIFGDEGKGLLDSGDPVADKNAIANFLKAYDQMHRFSGGSDVKLVLLVGAENWPAPIPVAKNSSGWYFDTPSAKQELLYRRIGENESSAIRILNAIVVGEHEYFGQSHDDDITNQYAQKFLSDPGKRNGLFWKVSAGEQESPIGPLVATASEEGYRANPEGKPVPIHGYIFKILTRQGKAAPGGAKEYLVDGKMSGGFAVLAYPASYRQSGVMTFMANADGLILQKDLGDETKDLVSSMTSYDPDGSWQRAQ
ncbi:MAG: DUF2950 domain-containing protein [Candidatus Binatus sp.]|uniref:DUF2950 domain-containing protein n=1 Tax=Candidatus Binatus sp. TaxID=2811406 RepID=UPI0027263887|nr:DUF2950 domain-containing protein [Candidatus Binatus sp.]MDO8432832.1 DUF2950 domain-containing protein [Candidatus Binatus sp.]